MSSTRGFRLGHISALDGVRAFAVTAVIASHTVGRLRGGGIGVQVFFVLSGFLITSLLLQERDRSDTVRLGSVYRRRALRLLPAVVVVIAGTAGYLLATGGDRHSLAAIPAALFYYANWQWFVHGTGFGVLGWFGHFWSLSVEEQFYLVWPVVLIVAARRRRLVPLLVAACVIPTVLRVVTITGAGSEHLEFGTPWIMDELAFGCLLAVALREREALVRRVCSTPAALAAAVVLLVSVVALDPAAIVTHTLVPTLIGLASAVLIGHLATQRAGLLARGLSVAPLVYLGRISYGMYLWHIFAALILQAHTSLHGAGWFLATYAATVAVASVSFYVVERPFLRLKDRASRVEVGHHDVRAAAEPQAGLRAGAA